MTKTRNTGGLKDSEYLALAEFRYQVRRFLRQMEEKAREAGSNPQQYQLILAIKGLPPDMAPSISSLADRMQLNHNSMVELVDRCEEKGFIRRSRSGDDRRQVSLSITPAGDLLLGKLASAARQELRTTGPMLVDSVLRLVQDSRTTKGTTNGGSRRHSGGPRKAGP